MISKLINPNIEDKENFRKKSKTLKSKNKIFKFKKKWFSFFQKKRKIAKRNPKILPKKRCTRYLSLN